MAKIGTAPYLAVQNHYADAAFNAAHVDTSFAAVIQQIGGTYWQAGVPVVAPGNLDATNFGAAGFTNTHKAEPYSPVAIHLAPNQKQSVIATVSMDVVSVLVAATTASGVTRTSAVVVSVNGTTRAQLSAPFQSNAGSNGLASRWAAVQEFPIYEGDRVMVDAADAFAAGCVSVTVAIWGKTLHVGNG